MRNVTNEELSLIAGGCLVDYRIAHGITDPFAVTPAVMVEVDCITGKPVPSPTYSIEDIL